MVNGVVLTVAAFCDVYFMFLVEAVKIFVTSGMNPSQTSLYTDVYKKTHS